MLRFRLQPSTAMLHCSQATTIWFFWSRPKQFSASSNASSGTTTIIFCTAILVDNLLSCKSKSHFHNNWSVFTASLNRSWRKREIVITLTYQFSLLVFSTHIAYNNHTVKSPIEFPISHRLRYCWIDFDLYPLRISMWKSDFLSIFHQKACFQSNFYRATNIASMYHLKYEMHIFISFTVHSVVTKIVASSLRISMRKIGVSRKKLPQLFSSFVGRAFWHAFCFSTIFHEFPMNFVWLSAFFWIKVDQNACGSKFHKGWIMNKWSWRAAKPFICYSGEWSW